MDRNKLLAILIGGLAALGSVAFLAGNAQAASWHDYSGDIYPGHAYGLVVPVNARAYEIQLAGDDAATARVSVFGPDGAKLGFYALSHDLPTAAIVRPSEGRHVIYVYDLSDGAGLKLRVDSEAAPPADLEKIDLARNDVVIGESSSPQKFDKSFTTKLDREPVFATLLYDGSVSGLDATVASTKGDVVTVKGESGTAFAPGVWSSQKGERASTPENFVGNAYTVTVHAAKFEGTMVLTTLGLDLKAPPTPEHRIFPAPHPSPSKPPAHPSAAPPRPAPLPADAIALPTGKAIAFHAEKGTLTLADAKATQPKNDGSNYVRDTLSIYGPDDALVAFVTLDTEHKARIVELPTSGEYVAFVHQASGGKGVFAYAKGDDGAAAALSDAHALALRKENLTFVVSGSGASGSAQRAFALAHVPVALQLRLDAGTTAVFGSAAIRNEQGVVAQADSLAQGPGVGFLSWSSQRPDHFAKGAHTLDVSGLVEGKLTLAVTSFVRDAPAPLEEAPAATAPEAPEEPHEGGLLGLADLVTGLL